MINLSTSDVESSLNITTGPTGNLIEGNVLDSARGPLEQALRDYDSQLYVKWNPKKLRGWGCWEVRRKPDLKTVKYSKPAIINPETGKIASHSKQGDVYEFDGFTICYPKYHESDIVHHVMDVPHLNYKILQKLYQTDTWRHSNKGSGFGKELDYKQDKALDREDESSFKEREYMIKQHKSEIKWFKDFVSSGGNPYRLVDFWPKDSK